MNSLTGRTALVTGASRGIGFAIAMKLSREGAAVGLVGRDTARVSAAATSVSNETGSPTCGVAADVSSWADAQRAVTTVRQELGVVDILVANAGVGVIGSVEEANPEDWREMMETNYLGTAHLVKACLPGMRAAGAGDIVAVVSAGGTRGYPEWSGYCASKWAVLGFMECLTREVTSAGIRATALCPGGVDTPFWDDLNKDLNRAGTEGRKSLMSPDVVAELVLVSLSLPRNVLLKEVLFFPTSEWH